MFRLKVALLLFIGLSVFLRAGAVEIRGTVLSRGGIPIEGAVVLHRSTDTMSTTDGEGSFSIDVPDGESVRLEVIHPDYYEQEFVITRKNFSQPLLLSLVPLIDQKEEILVTALRYPEPSVKVPAAGTVVSNEVLSETMAPNITAALQDIPGVSGLGSGGFSLVPTVRGLARRRILYLIDYARIESDRRTGPNASFLNPHDIAKIEVLRSPSSVFYGSDAIGGVIHLMTKLPDMREGFHGALSVDYGTVNREKGVGVIFGGAKGSTGFSLSFHNISAGNYSSPEAEVLQSQFSQGSLTAKLLHRTEKREIALSFLGARGSDIGKPNQNSDLNPTWYPRENQNLLQLHWREILSRSDRGEINFRAFLNPNFLETMKETREVDPGGNSVKSREEFSRTESTEYGAQLSYGRKFGDGLRLESGLDLFGRMGARAVNRTTAYPPEGDPTQTEEYPFVEGSRQDLGVFLSLDYSGWRNLDIIGGVRWDFLFNEAIPAGEGGSVRATESPGTGFLAVSYELSRNMSAFVNVSKAYRLPSLNELFYTGITGRGYIIGQPDLRSETSLNVDGGVRFLGRRFFTGIYGFRYEIKDMIERYRIDETTYTYGNIEKGRIQGLEIEFEGFPLKGWKVFGNLFTIRGRSLVTGVPLNDIPAFQFTFGSRAWVGRFSAEWSATFQFEKNNPGPAEIAISGTEFVNLRANYHWRSLNIYVSFSNLFNASYFGRPDKEAVLEPGRNLKIGMVYSF